MLKIEALFVAASETKAKSPKISPKMTIFGLNPSKTPCLTERKWPLLPIWVFSPLWWPKWPFLWQSRVFYNSQFWPCLKPGLKSYPKAVWPKRHTCCIMVLNPSQPGPKGWDFGDFGQFDLPACHLKLHLKTPKIDQKSVKNVKNGHFWGLGT